MLRLQHFALALAACFILFPAVAAEDPKTTAEFVQLCSDPAREDFCKDMLDDWLIFGSKSDCAPLLETVIQTMRQHPEWNGQDWTKSVDDAGDIICGK